MPQTKQSNKPYYMQDAQTTTLYMYPSTKKLLNEIRDNYGITMAKALHFAIVQYTEHLGKIHKK